ncbi:MAG: LysE family translocator [Stappiaceae bacterium]
MLTFVLAVFLLLITPGPGVLTTAGVGSGYGYKEGLVYVCGLCVGTNLVALAVVSGLAAVLLSDPVIRTILFWASACYLLFLAYKIAFSGTKLSFIGAPKPPGFIGGLMLQAINPKAYAVNTAMFTGFPIWQGALQAEIALKFLVINLIWIPVHILWLAAGVSLHRLNLAPETQLVINVLMALAMLGVVGLATWRQINLPVAG